MTHRTTRLVATATLALAAVVAVVWGGDLILEWLDVVAVAAAFAAVFLGDHQLRRRGVVVPWVRVPAVAAALCWILLELDIVHGLVANGVGAVALVCIARLIFAAGKANRLLDKKQNS